MLFDDESGDQFAITVTVPYEKRRLCGEVDRDNARFDRVCELTTRDNGEPGRGWDVFLLTTSSVFPEDGLDIYTSKVMPGDDILEEAIFSPL